MSRHSNGGRDHHGTAATLRALRRAARHALELGVRTGTPVYVIQDHRIVDLTMQDSLIDRKPRKQRESQ